MRPYLAIIKDSFKAALASRVLYVLLGIITLILILIAPFHSREVLDWELKRDQHVRRPKTMIRTLVDGKENTERPDLQRIWSKLSPELKQKLTADLDRDDESAADENASADPTQVRERLNLNDEFIAELNRIIQSDDLYETSAWESRALDSEAEGLIESGVESLSDERRRRLNRLLMASSFPTLQSGSATTLDFYYFGWKWSFLSTNMTHNQFASGFAIAIPWFFDKFVMSIGLFIAILVTANIIPETFDPGSLNLLLSKPISRWALLISKFVGGCAFVSLCATYLMFGTWLWLGLALDIWDRAFLYSIPLYILVFAVYYSVSVFVGILYRSAILSVVLTAIFWGICFTVGLVYGRLDTKMENSEATRLVAVDDEVLFVDPLQRVLGWDDATAQWRPRLKTNMRQEEEIGIGIVTFMQRLVFPPGLGPTVDRANGLIVSAAFDINNPIARNREIYVARTDDMQFEELGKYPTDTTDVFAYEGRLIAVTSTGKFFQLNHEQVERALDESAQPDAPDSETAKPNPSGDGPSGDQGPGDAAAGSGSTGASAPSSAQSKKKSDLFDPIGPDQAVGIRGPSAVDLNLSNGNIAIFRQREITLFKPDENGEYRNFASLRIDTGADPMMRGSLAYQGDTIVLVLGNGQVITLDADPLAEKKGYLPESRAGIQQVVGAPGGRYFALVFANENCWLLDMENDGQLQQAQVEGQGGISAVCFTPEGRLWVADRTDRVTQYDLETGEQIRRYTPQSDWFARAFRLVVRPVYRIFPKPSETYKVVTHLSQSGDSRFNRDVDLTRTPVTEDPWSPVLSGLGFMLLMLVCACLVFNFKDY